MPLTRKQRLDHDTWLGVWKMDEPLDILPRPRHVDLGQYKTQRLREKLTEYALLGELTNVDGLMINHDEDARHWWRDSTSASATPRAGRQ